MKTYKTPTAKVVEIDPDTLICLNPSSPDAYSNTEGLVEDEFEW